jgi:hypothetical protein
MSDKTVMVQHVIYDSPADYPGRFVVRRWLIGRGGSVTPSFITLADSLEKARQAIPQGLDRIPRSPGDERQIVETWL